MVIFGTIGIFRRNIEIGSAALASLRSIIGMLVLIIISLFQKHKFSFESIRNNIKCLLISGIFLGVNWILLFEAYNYTSIAAATLFYYTAPIIVIILSPVLLKEKLTGRKIISILITLLGLIFITGIFNSAGSVNFKGILFSLGAAIFYAGVIILNKKIVSVHAYEKTIIQLGSAALIITPYAAFSREFGECSISPKLIVLVLIIGIVHTGILYALYFGAIDKLSAQTSAILGFIDPVSAIFFSILFLHEKINALEIIGCFLILFAVFFSEISDKNMINLRNKE